MILQTSVHLTSDVKHWLIIPWKWFLFDYLIGNYSNDGVGLINDAGRKIIGSQEENISFSQENI